MSLNEQIKLRTRLLTVHLMSAIPRTLKEDYPNGGKYPYNLFL